MAIGGGHWGRLTVAVIKRWSPNTNTCYGDFGAGCIIEGGLLTQVQTHAMGPLIWLHVFLEGDLFIE